MKSQGLLYSFTLLWALTASAPSNPQSLHDNNPFCRTYSSFNKHLKTYNEEKIWIGSSGGNTYELYSSKDGIIENNLTQMDATWTISYNSPEGKKCLVASGVRWDNSFSASARVQKVPSSRNLGGSFEKKPNNEEPENARSKELSDFVIGNTRLKPVGSCDNHYSLSETVDKNPYVIGRGTVEVASDRAIEHTMSINHPDYLFILSSSPGSEKRVSNTWAILFPLLVANAEFTKFGCTYIEAVGVRGRRLRWTRVQKKT